MTEQINLIRRMTALDSDSEILRERRSGRWCSAARGVYADSREWAELDRDARHVAAARAYLPKLSGSAVISHTSAAAVHGLPLFRIALSSVHISRATPTTSKRYPNVHAHASKLGPADLTEIDGLPVTSVPRTLLDCARIMPFEAAIVLMDAALHRGLVTVEELLDQLDRHPRMPGLRAASRAIRFADGRSESVGESRSRVIMAKAGLPRMTLQFDVHDANGRLLARCDFADEESGVVGEFDGRVKYGRLLKPGQDPGEVVFDEKVREDLIRDTGLAMVRWIWAELDRPQAMLERWRRQINRRLG